MAKKVRKGKAIYEFGDCPFCGSDECGTSTSWGEGVLEWDEKTNYCDNCEREFKVVRKCFFGGEVYD